MIPAELIDMIVDLIHDHPVTLHSCALVSRAFSQTAQNHLFSIIKLDAPTSSHLHLNSCQRFYEIIRESPRLATYVRQLFIVDGYHKVNSTHGTYGTCRYSWVTEAEETLPKIFSQLTNLQCLSIQGSISTLEWDTLSVKVQDAILTASRLPQISKFELINTSGFLPLSKCATNAKWLRLLNSGSPKTAPFFPDVVTPNICKPYSLELSSTTDRIDWNLGPGIWLDPSALRSIILQYHVLPSDTEKRFFERLFTSQALEHIQLHLPSPMPFLFLTDLSLFPQLRSFYIDFRGNISTHRLGYATWLIELINSIPDTNCIETIAIQLSRRSPDDLLILDEYAKLDQALSRPALKSLRSVRAKVAIMARPFAYRFRLPLVDARGILQIEPGAVWVTNHDQGCSPRCTANITQ